MNHSPEKRQSQRFPVSIRVEKDEHSKIVFGYTRDISVHGIAIVAEVIPNQSDMPSIGEAFKMKFKLPTSDLYISAFGKVVRLDLVDHKPPVVGLQFIDMELGFRKLIEEYMHSMG